MALSDPRRTASGKSLVYSQGSTVRVFYTLCGVYCSPELEEGKQGSHVPQLVRR